MTNNQNSEDKSKDDLNESPGLKKAKKITVNTEQPPLKFDAVAMGAIYKGPIPQAVEMERYKQVSPDLPGRIMKMAENQAKARQENEHIQVKAESRDGLLGILSAFLIMVMFFILAIFCVVYGYPLAGISAAFGGVGSIIVTFIYGTSHRNKNNKNKKD